MKLRLKTTEETALFDQQTRTIKIGRDRENDFIIKKTDVSRFHAVLEWDFPTWTIRDLGSGNGSWVNDVKLEKDNPVSIKQDDEIFLGKNRFEVVDVSAPIEDRQSAEFSYKDTFWVSPEDLKREQERERQNIDVSPGECDKTDGADGVRKDAKAMSSMAIFKPADGSSSSPAKKTVLAIAAIAILLLVVVGVGAKFFMRENTPPPPLPSKVLAVVDNLVRLQKEAASNGAVNETIDSNRYTLTFADGKPRGPCAGFYASGKPMLEGNFENGRKNGPWRGFHENGKKWFEMTFKDDKPHGDLFIYYDIGDLFRKTGFKANGKVDYRIDY